LTSPDDWTDPDPAELLVLAGDADWADLASRYAGFNDMPLRRCLEVARAGGATTVVIETRYIDVDYRSEYSALYSRAFRSHPDSAHRLHFFKAPLDQSQLWSLPDDHGYLGYVVIRPSDLGQVGRSVLTPPPGVAGAVRTSVRDEVAFFGSKLLVEGAPFIQQDTQLGRCAHAAAWMCHYTAFRKGFVARQPMANFSLAADPSLGNGRSLPSEGLTLAQLIELFRTFGLPASYYDVQQLPPSVLAPFAPPDPDPPEPVEGVVPHPGLWDTRLFRTCCRYLNSGIPVLVATYDHTFVLVGYRRVKRAGERDWIEFIRHDDQRGPYLTVGDVFNDVADDGLVYSPWEALVIPLPEKLWLPPEPAEGMGGLLLQELAETSMSTVPETKELIDLIARGDLGLHVYARTANEFKSDLQDRVDPVLVREYRLARFSRFVWVVEAIDRKRRRDESPCVVGEALFDATSSETDPDCLAMHVPGLAWVARTKGSPRFPIRCSPDPYRSGGIGDP
jgi:hypothetical protein